MTAVEPEAGRLDRILAGPQVEIMRDQLDRWLNDEIHRPGLPFDSADVTALLDAVDNYRVRAAGLERECAALAAALGQHAHDFVPDPSALTPHCHDRIGEDEDGWGICAYSADDPIHRTPARVRAELETR